jgi:phosphatidylethanolamine/phosphatidyl-N-methylethanolamine N-methyltransferase
MQMPDLERFRLRPDSRLAFLQGFFERPREVGSIVPSSRFVERRLVELSGAASARSLVELGPGTGGTTRALLAAMPRAATLLAVEANPRFAAILEQESDPRLVVHWGRAEELPRILAGRGLEPPQAVISGIPFSTMSDATGRAIVEQVWEALAPAGTFLAYQIRGRVREVARPVFGPGSVELELLNIPPARIYRWRKRTDRAVPRG